jgi:hypothetical protein
MLSITVFDLLSLAFISISPNPIYFDIMRTIELLPIPGGPEIMQAFAFTFI